MADMFKFTGKNGGDPLEYWRSIAFAARVNIVDALKMGRFLVHKKILPQTARGVDFAGKPFERYTDDYARRKGFDTVNLRVRGRMLDALKISVNGRIYQLSARGSQSEIAQSMAVGIYDNQKQATKGAVHNEGSLTRAGRLRGAVRRIPKRRWLDATPATVKEVNQVGIESIKARVGDLL